METPNVKTRAIMSQDFIRSKVQRLSRKGVHSSEWKWEATPEGVGDIVYSAW